MTKYINLFFAALTTVFVGLFTVVLLPALFVYWLLYWRPMEWRELTRAANPHSPTDAVVCDGGEEHPFFEEWQRLEEMRRMQVDSTPFEEWTGEARR
jgi:hypothetical protein